MENLNQTEATPSSAKITWKVPFNLQLFPPGLEFRIAYHIQASWVDTTVFHVRLGFSAPVAKNETLLSISFSPKPQINVIHS